MNACKCTNKCTCKKTENVFLYDYEYTKVNVISKSSKCVKKTEVIIPDDTFCLATNLEPKVAVCVDDDCVSITSKDSYTSFDSWQDNDEILDNEILRAKVVFKKKYESGAN
jgi:hypothetical protein